MTVRKIIRKKKYSIIYNTFITFVSFITFDIFVTFNDTIIIIANINANIFFVFPFIFIPPFLFFVK